MDEADSPAALKARALRHLVRREHSRAELARKLAPHAASPEALQSLLDELARARQLSDARFAEARTRVLARKYGAARIRQDLKAKGVSDELIAALSPQGELERARAIVERKYRTPAGTREERARRARFLQSRGFSAEIVSRVLRLADEDG